MNTGKILKRNKYFMMSLMAMMMVFLIFLIKMKKVDAASGTEWDWTKEVLENYEERGLKKTKDGF